MVKLRLRRKGRTHLPMYDIVAVDSRKKRDSDFIERLGFYNPHTQPSTFKVNNERAIYWLNVGAQPTDMVRKILSYEGALLERSLRFKGVSEEEIAKRVEEHKEKTAKNYFRLKEQRKKREAAREARRIQAEKEAAAAAAAAEAAAKEAEEKAAAEAAAAAAEGEAPAETPAE